MRIMVGSAGILVAIIFVVFGYWYKDKSDLEKAEAMRKQQEQEIARAKMTYEEKLNEALQSADPLSLKNLYTLVEKDIFFFNSIGWKMDEVLCNVNNCNMRYSRIKDKRFQYVVLKKGNEEYKPVFNENEQSYTKVMYPIDTTSNIIFEDKLEGLLTCTDFIVKLYGFNTMITTEPSTKLEIKTPTAVFSLGKDYEWATYSKLKKGSMEFKTKNAAMLDLLDSELNHQLVKFKVMTLKGTDIQAGLDYYCF